MPDDNALLLSLLINSGLAQYPDKKLYNAAALLQPAERPTLPVHLENNDYNKRPTGAWFDNANPDAIHVSQNSPYYKNGVLSRIAAALAHEQVHVTNGPSETPAYQKEAEVLTRLDPKGSKQRIKDIATLIQRYGSSNE